MLSGRWFRAATRAGALALVGAFGVGASSCSLLIDKNADQCEANTDCTKFPGTTCQENVCIAAACQTITDCSEFPGTICKDQQCVPAGDGCAKNADCASQGDYTICRKDTGTCEALQSPTCATVLGDWQSDDAVVFGSILPLTGPDADTGAALLDSIHLALDDFQRVNDLPPAPNGKTQRPLVFVACDDKSDTTTAETSATHLVNDVGVQAILGCAFSGISISVATDVTIPAGVLLFSPSATSTSLTSLADHGLVWRTSPSDVYQAAALKHYVPETVEAQVRSEQMLQPTDKIKVDILFKGDAYGSGLEHALVSTPPILQINGAGVTDAENAGQFNAYDYGNKDDPSADPVKSAMRVAQVLADRPDIVLVLGTNEGVTDLFEKIEDQWGAGTRPKWVFSDGGEVKDLYQYIGGNASLRTRVTGTVPGTNGLLFQTFRALYNGAFSDGTNADTFGTAGSYDIAYLLAYSAVALGDQALTGANFNKVLGTKFETGVQVNAGDDPTNAFQQLQAGNAVNFEGASGSLKFNASTGEAPSDIQIWCVTHSGTKANGERNSGLFYDANNDLLSGTFNMSTCGP